MPDWKRIVREKLGTLPLRSGRRGEVVEELAQQLESAYDEALAQGLDEPTAMRRSLAQFQDWQGLRSEIFQSVEGTRLPVWEQHGILAPRRAPVWIALALALLLLALPSFRQALALLPVPGTDPGAWSSRVFSERALRRMERGDKEKYARALAFVALHSKKEDDRRAVQAAEKAIALDPRLTWISAKLSHSTYAIPGYDPHPWIERLKAWDPQNGFPYLLEADANVHWWEPPWSRYGAAASGLRLALASEPRWRIPMEKAFAAPRMDFYSAQQFALDRQVLQEQAFDRPDILILGMWFEPMPDFMAMDFYVDGLLEDGQREGESGRADEALARYRSVAGFGERLAGASSYQIEVLSAKYRRRAYEKMLSLLASRGREEASSALESALAAQLETLSGKKRPFAVSRAAADRSGHIVDLFGLLVALLSVATFAWLVAVSALKWKPNVNPGLNRLASVLSAAPALLLLSSVALFLGYYPYARSIAEYASLEELQEGFGPFFMGVWGFPDLSSFTEIWLPRMVWPSVWCAAVALLGACVLAWIRSRSDLGDTDPGRPVR